jgi:tetraacyldisaccharide 4'-kinase
LIKLKLPKFWSKRSFLSYFLLPFSWVYCLVINLYRIYFKLILSKNKFPVPIIVVGNITVGGTGKTPMVIELSNILIKKGFNPGIISKGYGRKSKGLVEVKTDSTAEEVGDEALLIKRRTRCPIIIDDSRRRAAQMLVDNFKCSVIISDDGLQHYSLPRQVEIAVIDDKFDLGNKFCLPAGPLREPANRLNCVDFIVRNFNCNLEFVAPREQFGMVLQPVVFRKVKDRAVTKKPDEFKRKTIHAACGIGLPEKFFNTLKRLGLTIVEHPFPDHHRFTSEDFPFNNDIIIMTEKDSVKCEKKPWLNDNFWFLEVEARLEEKFIADLLLKLRSQTISL